MESISCHIVPLSINGWTQRHTSTDTCCNPSSPPSKSTFVGRTTPLLICVSPFDCIVHQSWSIYYTNMFTWIPKYHHCLVDFLTLEIHTCRQYLLELLKYNCQLEGCLLLYKKYSGLLCS